MVILCDKCVASFIFILYCFQAKPCRNLWISNICSSVTKEQLEAEFKRFGVVEDLRFLRDRSCAFVDFTKTDDAICALESLNRKKLGKEELHIEYGRSTQQSKKVNPTTYLCIDMRVFCLLQIINCK